MKDNHSTGDFQALSIRNSEESEKMITENVIKIATEYFDVLSHSHVGSRNKEEMYQAYITRLKNKHKELRNQFHNSQFGAQNTITVPELAQFFSESPNRNPDNAIDSDYIFTQISCMYIIASGAFSIDYFIFEYVKYEEKVLAKLIIMKRLSEKLTESKGNYSMKEKAASQERTNKDGVSDNATLNLTLFEVKDSNALAKPLHNPHAVLSLSGKKQKSDMNQDLAFPISKKNEELLIEVYEELVSNTGSQLVGSVKIPLSLFDHQQSAENWYQLLKNDQSISVSIHLKIWLIYNWQKYYSDQAAKTENQIKRLNNDIACLDSIHKFFTIPFGLILQGGINLIKEKRLFGKSEEICEYEASIRQSVYGRNNQSKTIKEPLSLDSSKLEWSVAIKVIVGIALLSSFLAFITRADYLNLIALIISFVFIFGEIQDGIEFRLLIVIYILIGLLCYDVLWIVLHYNKWDIDFYGHSFVLFLTLVVSIINCGLKSALTVLLLFHKTRISNIKKEGIEKIIGSKI